MKTRTVSGTLEPVWNEEFTVELEGSENLRLLVYQVERIGEKLGVYIVKLDASKCIRILVFIK